MDTSKAKPNQSSRHFPGKRQDSNSNLIGFQVKAKDTTTEPKEKEPVTSPSDIGGDQKNTSKDQNEVQKENLPITS